VWDIASDAIAWSDHAASVFADIPPQSAGKRRGILKADRARAVGPDRRA